MKEFPTIADFIGKTPLVRLQRMAKGSGSELLVKLEGNNLVIESQKLVNQFYFFHMSTP